MEGHIQESNSLLLSGINFVEGVCQKNDGYLYKYIKEICNNNTIIISFTNFGYVDHALNLYESLKLLNIKNYLIFTFDQKSFDILKELNVNTFLLEVENAIYQENSHNFGSVEFNAICNIKPCIVLECLKSGFDVVWTDTDIVWLKDPLNYFMQFTHIDMLVQNDDDDICAGYFYIKSNERSIYLLNEVIKFINPWVDDQTGLRRFLNDREISTLIHSPNIKKHNLLANNDILEFYLKEEIIDDGKLKYMKLDRALFPNGTAYFNVKLPQRLGIIPYIVHNNCIIGHDSKKIRFQDFNLWFTDYDSIPKFINPSYKDIGDTNLEPIHVLKGFREIITTILVSNDKTKLYIFSHDKTVRIYDLSFQCLEAVFVNRKGSVFSADNIPTICDDAVFITGGHDKMIKAWDLKWKELFTLKGHYGYINDVKFHNNVLFSCSDDQTIISWDLTKKEKIKTYKGCNGWVSQICFKGNALFGCSEDGTIKAWDISTGRVLQVYKGHDGWVRSIFVLNDYVYSAGSDGSIRKWNMKNGECLLIVKNAHNAGINCIKYLDGLILSACDQGYLKIWKLDNEDNITQKHVIKAHDASIICIDIFNDHIITGGYDRVAKVWKI